MVLANVNNSKLSRDPFTMKTTFAKHATWPKHPEPTVNSTSLVQPTKADMCHLWYTPKAKWAGVASHTP